MKEPASTSWEWTGLGQWGRDLRHAARGLWRAPVFSLAVFCSLVVCLGPNAATLSALYAFVLKPLPFPEPAQLVTVVNVAEKSGGQLVQSSTTQYLDFKAHADLFSGFSAIRHDDATLDQLEHDGQVLFRYVHDDGTPALDPDDPANPNGSLRGIAGVCNEAGNVAGLMPHPERMSEEILGSDEGMQLIRSLVESAKEWEAAGRPAPRTKAEARA